MRHVEDNYYQRGGGNPSPGAKVVRALTWPRYKRNVRVPNAVSLLLKACLPHTGYARAYNCLLKLSCGLYT